MADVTEPKVEPEKELSDFQRYIEQNPQAAEKLMEIMVNLYNYPMKVSQVQPHLHQMLNISTFEDGMTD